MLSLPGTRLVTEDIKDRRHQCFALRANTRLRSVCVVRNHKFSAFITVLITSELPGPTKSNIVNS